MKRIRKDELNPKGPPRASAEEIRKAALEFAELHDQLGCGARTVQIDDPPKRAYDVHERGVGYTNVDALRSAEGAKVAEALKLDPERMAERLGNQELLWDGYQRVRALRLGAADGERAADSAELLARGLVSDAAWLVAHDGSMDEDEAQAMLRELADIQEEEAQLLTDQKVRVRNRRIREAAGGVVQDLEDQRRLLRTFGAMESQEALDWDELLEAADLYEKIIGKESDRRDSDRE